MAVFVPNPAGLALLGKEVDHAIKEIAEKAAERARQLAPVETGAYRDSIRVEDTPEGARLVAGGGAVDYAGFVEVGTSDTPAFHVLVRAVVEGQVL